MTSRSDGVGVPFRLALVLVGVGVAGLLAGCPEQFPREPAVPTAVPAGWSCAVVMHAEFGGYRNSTHAQLRDGEWSDKAGNRGKITTCAIGDLDGDGPDDALAAVEFIPVDQPWREWWLAVWQDNDGQARFVTELLLGEGTPVVSVDFRPRATVVWDRPSPDNPPTTQTLRRTSLFTLAGGRLYEDSHADVAGPCQQVCVTEQNHPL